jgi:signal transduction histidine kinase
VGNLENNIMLTNWGALSQTEFTQSTQSLGQEISQVRNMLDNVLHWAISQMKGMKPNKVQFDLAAVAEDQIKLLLPTSVAKSIQIQNNVPANTYLIADQNHLAVILRNLLQNALKFTHAGGHVDLKAHLLQNKVLIEVTDTGVGMSAEQLTHLFSLEKSSSRLGTSLEQGTGLGLVLVKELVEANGGSVTVESQEGIGTTFTLAF